MRATTAIVILALATPAWAADRLPVFRPGLWDFKRSVDGGDGRPATLTNQKCTSPTDDMNAKTESLALAGCQPSPVNKNGNMYSFSLKCTIQGIAIESKSLITVINDAAYEVDVESKQGSSTTREKLIARRIGNCEIE